MAALIYLNNVEATPQVNLVYLKQLLERKLTFDDQVVQDVLDISGSLRCLVFVFDD